MIFENTNAISTQNISAINNKSKNPIFMVMPYPASQKILRPLYLCYTRQIKDPKTSLLMLHLSRLKDLETSLVMPNLMDQMIPRPPGYTTPSGSDDPKTFLIMLYSTNR